MAIVEKVFDVKSHDADGFSLSRQCDPREQQKKKPLVCNFHHVAFLGWVSLVGIL
jgi:hypothetical protein